MSPHAPPGAGNRLERLTVNVRQLHSLARLHRIQRRYTGADGRRHTVPDGVLTGVLGALGAFGAPIATRGAGDIVPSGRAMPAGDRTAITAAVDRSYGVSGSYAVDVSEAWRSAQSTTAAQVLPPVVAYRSHDRTATVPVSLVEPTVATWVELVTEDGRTVHRRFGETTGGLATGGAVLDGRRIRYTSMDLHRLAADLPGGRLPLGYHGLTIETSIGRSQALVISAPDRCPAPRQRWGLIAPLYSIRGSGDVGAGSFTDLGDLADWVADLGGGYTGTLPLYSGFLDGPDPDPSPYRPASRLAWNEAYLDLARLPELALAPAAAAELASPELLARQCQLRDRPLASLPDVVELKRRVLQPVAEAFFTTGANWSSRRDEFGRWLTSRPEMVAYSWFRAERERRGDTDDDGEHRLDAGDHGAGHRRVGGHRAAGNGAGIQDTSMSPERFRRPGVRWQELANDPAMAYHLYAQWATEQQLTEVAGRRSLYLDVPVGVHPDGFDPWWEPDTFVAGASIGAPPDTFFAEGQSWGLPPLHPEGIRRQGYRHVAEVLRRAMSVSEMVRLDHVMGLHRLWVIPEGASARHGAYVQYRADELRAIVALEAHRAGAAVVGEDLGTVPAAVRRAMHRDGMLRSSVWQFGATAENPVPDPIPASLATLGTHDLPPFAAVVADHPDLGRALGPDLVGGLRRCLIHLAASSAAVVLVDLADLWLEKIAQNQPGTGAGENFRLRARQTLSDLQSDPQVTALLRAVDAARRASNGAIDP